jgi:hypothetical protein
MRMTRGLLRTLIADPPPGYRIEPVLATGGHYVYARSFSCRSLKLSEARLSDDPVEAGRGDIFLALEWGADVAPAMKDWFVSKRYRGTQLAFLVHDMLPILRPELFPPEIVPLATCSIRTVAEIADRLICISRTVADQLHNWLAEAQPRRLKPLSIGYLRLGAEQDASQSESVSDPAGISRQAWKGSSRQLLSALLGSQIYRSWPDHPDILSANVIGDNSNASGNSRTQCDHDWHRLDQESPGGCAM